MQLGKITSNWKVLGVVFLILIIALSVWIFLMQREAKRAETLTPEAVVEAFQKAGYIIDNVQEIDKYPVPLLPSEHGIRFSVTTSDGVVNVSAILYNSESEAKLVSSSISDFNRAMSSQYVLYGFSRGSVVLSFVTDNQKTARQFKRIFRSIQ
jgi:hypothetical protein